MNAEEEQVSRLLRAAAKVTPAGMPPAPFGFATRTLAHWQSERRDGDLAVVRVCRRAVLCALSAAMLAGIFASPYLTAKSDSTQYVGRLSVAAGRLALHGQE
jgi:hypothetical protein